MGYGIRQHSSITVRSKNEHERVNWLCYCIGEWLLFLLLLLLFCCCGVMVCLQVHEMQVPTIRMLYKFENETFALKKDEVRNVYRFPLILRENVENLP